MEASKKPTLTPSKYRMEKPQDEPDYPIEYYFRSSPKSTDELIARERENDPTVVDEASLKNKAW
jgi:hypothetical protein